jgi:hypothetical protein
VLSPGFRTEACASLSAMMKWDNSPHRWRIKCPRGIGQVADGGDANTATTIQSGSIAVRSVNYYKCKMFSFSNLATILYLLGNPPGLRFTNRVESARPRNIFDSAYSTFSGSWRRVGYNSGCNSPKIKVRRAASQRSCDVNDTYDDGSHDDEHSVRSRRQESFL